jgi:hypothetical protein
MPILCCLLLILGLIQSTRQCLSTSSPSGMTWQCRSPPLAAWRRQSVLVYRREYICYSHPIYFTSFHHPCSSNVSSILNDGAAMDDFYERLANCVKRQVCRPDGYCKSKDGKFRFHFHFDLVNDSRIVFEKIGNTDSVRAKIVLKRNDKFMNVHNR